MNEHRQQCRRVLQSSRRRLAEYHVLHTQYAKFDDNIVNVANNSIFLGGSTGLQTGDAVKLEVEDDDEAPKP